MRIIGGEFKGRRFMPPAKNWPTRPTTDYAKEGLYNILANNVDFSEIRFLDLFGGTGNHCYEMISRGCSDATYVDKFPGCVKFVYQIKEQLKIGNELKICKTDVFKFVKYAEQNRYDVIFAGPPYGLKTIDAIPDLILEKNLLSKSGFLILEHNPNVKFDDHPFKFDERHYSKTIFTFFKQLQSEEEE